MRAKGLPAILAVAGLAFAPPARAQPAPKAAPASEAAPPAARTSVIVPPKPITALHADYPEGGLGDHEVVVQIVVAVDGSVRSARVVAGDEPFAGAAIGASSSWRFEPATRDGKPFVASIKAAIRFIAPVVEPASPVPLAASPVDPAASPPPAKPLEVTVEGERAPGVVSLSRAEVRLLPGAFGDPFRAIDALPGVTPLASGVPFYYVRGAPPGNVGYFLDGIRVPLLFHIGLGPSVIHPAIVDRVDLYSGGYPAAYGRYAGGIVAGETKGPAEELHAEASIRLVDAGLMVEAPLRDIGKIPGLGVLGDASGSVFIAGRYSYTAALLSLIQSQVSLAYWDYQARIAVNVTPRDTITLFAFGAHDFLGDKDDNGAPETLFDTTFHRLDLRYDRRLGAADERLRAGITLGYEETDFSGGDYAYDRSIAARLEIQKHASPEVLVRGGIDGEVARYGSSLKQNFATDPQFTSLFPDRTDFIVGAHVDAVLQIGPRFEVTPGVRIDFWDNSVGHAVMGIDPRIATRLAIGKDLHLITTSGLASQPPSFIVPGPGFTRDFTGGLQRAWQESIGVDADLPWDVTGNVTVFRNAFFNMTDALGTAPTPTSSSDFPSTLNARVDGSSIGLEVLLKRRLTRRLGGLVSYTLSRSERILPTGVVPSSFDRTHVLNVAGSYDFGRGFRGGSRIVFYTGFPVDVTRPALGRVPAFGRFDARVEKKWSIASGRGWISLVLEAQNAFGAKETIQEQCVSVSTPCKSTQIGPVTIPSIGVEGGL